MKSWRHDLIVLWKTRKTSGFPWPFRYGIGPRWRPILTGYSAFSPVPLWRQIIRIPVRPWRYAKLVRGVAKTRANNFQVADYDSVE